MAEKNDYHSLLSVSATEIKMKTPVHFLFVWYWQVEFRLFSMFAFYDNLSFNVEVCLCK